MTNDVAKPAGAVAVPRSEDEIKELVRKPFKQLPVEWVPVVFDFWCFWADVFKRHNDSGQLGLCSRVRWWMLNDGLTLAELSQAMDAVRRAERASRFEFPSQVLAALADQIDAVRKAARDAERQAAKDAELALFKGRAANRGLHELADSFPMPKG